MGDAIDIVVRPDGDSWGAWSPQLAGFAAVEPTAEQLRAALPEAVAFAAGESAHPPITVHVEFEIGGVVARVAQDNFRWERQHVAERLSAALAVEDQVGHLRSAPVNTLGDVVYVCAMPSDPVSWIARQMDPKSDWLTAVVSVADEMIWTYSFGVGHENHAEADEFDLPLDTPMSFLMASHTASRVRLSG